MAAVAEQFLSSVLLASDGEKAKTCNIQDNAKSILPGTNSKFCSRKDSSDSKSKSTQSLMCSGKLIKQSAMCSSLLLELTVDSETCILTRWFPSVLLG